MPDTEAAAAPLASKLARGKLLQVLGVSFGIAVIIGNTILVGILRTPGDVAGYLPVPLLFLGVWIVGGLYALLGAISLAEPGAMIGFGHHSTSNLLAPVFCPGDAPSTTNWR